MAIDTTQFGNLSNFKYWCQKVLPAVYDDSLSYYELLAKVVQYLNDTIDVVNMQTEKIKELADFINNANIQEMVRVVLREMEEDGTLADIINQEIFEELNDKIEYLFDYNTDYRGWAGWDVNTFGNNFLCSRALPVNHNKNFTQSAINPDIYYYDFKFVNACSPNELHLAANTDRYFFVGNINGHKHYGIDARLYAYVPPANMIDDTCYVRMVEHATRYTIPETCPLSYNSSAGEAIANIAKSYYSAMLNGREFAYGANFFYLSPNNIINDADGKGRMECDTFVGLCLRGINYNNSPYSILTPNFQYSYDEMYIDVSDATEWTSGNSYNVDDVVTYAGNTYICDVANSDVTFSTLNFHQIWTINTGTYFNVINSTLHPANPYLGRDIRFMSDYGIMGFEENTVFTDKTYIDGEEVSLHQAKTGDIAIWRRVDGKPIEFGGSSISPGFDNIAHVGILSIEDGEAYIYHVSNAAHTFGHIVDRIAIRDLSDANYAPPDYFVRPRYLALP